MNSVGPRSLFQQYCVSVDGLSADNCSRKFDNAKPKKQSFGRLYASFKNIKFSEVATVRPMAEFFSH